MIRLVSPRLEPVAVASTQGAPRLATLDGVVLGLLANETLAVLSAIGD